MSFTILVTDNKYALVMSVTIIGKKLENEMNR